VVVEAFEIFGVRLQPSKEVEGGVVGSLEGSLKGIGGTGVVGARELLG
jgi:hypothetical protein